MDDLTTSERVTENTGPAIPGPADVLLRAMVARTSDLVALYDHDGRLVYTNPAYNEVAGRYSGPGNSDPLRPVHPEDRRRVHETLFLYACNGIESQIAYRLISTDGEIRRLAGTACPVRDDTGHVSHVLFLSRDETETSRLEEALARLGTKMKDAQEMARLGNWEWNLGINTVTFSGQLKTILGLPGDAPNYMEFDRIFRYIHRDAREHAARTIRDALANERKYELELPITGADGTLRVIYTRARIDRNRSGQPVRVVGVFQDVTEQNLAKEKSRKNEESFRLMVENVLNYAFYLLDTGGRVTTWNPGAERMMGYTDDEIIGEHFLRFYPPESITASDPGRQMDLAVSRGRYESEGWRMRKDHSRFWARVIIVPLYSENDELYGFAKITHDLTEWKRTEEDLRSHANRLKSLSRRLVEVQETERRHLAGELHDLVGPNLTAVSINLRLIADSLPEQLRTSLDGSINECVSLLQSMVDALRGVIGELRPNALDDYGLVSALRSHAHSYSLRTGIRVRIPEGDPALDLPDVVKLGLFRIAQEALNNTAKHSQANEVRVALDSADGVIRLTVEDDGTGFDPDRRGGSGTTVGYGLLIMRERAEAIGADFNIDSARGRGVKIMVEYRE